MSSDSQDKRRPVPLLKSFSFALCGIKTAVKAERNMQIHVVFSVLAIAASIYFSISKVEWLFVLLVIGGMFSLEMVNSAVERVVDLVTSERHPLAKQAKDLAAGAVFIYAILSVIIGVLIFLPHIIKLVNL